MGQLRDDERTRILFANRTRRDVLKLMLAGVAGGAALTMTGAGAFAAGNCTAKDASCEALATPVAGYPQGALDLVAAVLADVKTGMMPGAVMYIDSPRGRLVDSAGVGNIQTGAAIDPKAVFQIGSNTKMMTSAIVLQLQEEGLLSIDDLLSVYYPEVAAALSGGDTITLKMLLNHTSGLYDYVEDLAANAFATHHQTGSDSALTQAWTPAEMLDYFVTYRAGNSYFSPGAAGAWHYSNTNYLLLGLIIEKTTGKSYAQNLQARIFDPLGLANTKLIDGVWTSDLKGYYQAPFDWNTGAWNLSQGWAAGGAVSTPADLAVFVRALFGGKLFKNPATLKLMQTTVQAPLVYGLGVVQFGDVAWGHGGQTFGFFSHVVYNVETDTVVIAWTNTATTKSLTFSLLDLLAPSI